MLHELMMTNGGGLATVDHQKQRSSPDGASSSNHTCINLYDQYEYNAATTTRYRIAGLPIVWARGRWGNSRLKRRLANE